MQVIKLKMHNLQQRFFISLSLSLQRHYSPGWAPASFKSFLHPSLFRVTIVQLKILYIVRYKGILNLLI